MITVFYDGACGLCAREIDHYQRLAPAGVFSWIDITQTPEPFTARGYAVSDGLLALHVEDNAGVMHVGADAFIIIWQQLPHWHLLARLAKLPLVMPVANWLYCHFARWRFKRLGYDRCELPEKKHE